ncbi:rhomboid family intramembrane serine protease [Microbacterium sorbitolivorans]|uniref:Rhomboid family intramembrane serine protease n=1 Tax=Microbacterium sorbitolivorans TaxID=1867410 RepID=A0A367Y2A7_9MICO|nr:rhomboid family intramembrane serine protease [Microbacterium sorbitolivorans]RCK59958.1 rhomboid family intramembrane serine protease [Microbacterium sorbitolivorans]GGF41446.1 rhomboid family intramembrane serine protease [Microbacterium sorbitolivorans]
MTDTSGASLRDNPDNYCYRHPDRQSFVLCQRCTRTICTECMTQASVGFICPECLKEQKKNRTPAQKRAQRRWGTGSGSRAGAVSFGSSSTRGTTTIFAVTALVYLLQMLGSVVPAIKVQSWLLFWAPYLYPSLSGVFEPWRILTAAFVHGGLWHVALNMLTLWMVGRSLEPALGTWRFVTTYLLSAAGGSAGVALLGFGTPVVGASGALFGLFGALIVIGRAVGANLSGLYITLGINLVLGFVPGFNIAWQAHIGGLIVGAAIGFIFTRTRRPKQRWLQIGLLCLVGVIVAAAFVLPLFGVYAQLA